jgi:methionine-gamma-lyase
VVPRAASRGILETAETREEPPMDRPQDAPTPHRTGSRRAPGFATRQIHTGGHPDPYTGSLSMPIFQTSTFVMKDAAHGAELFAHHGKGYVYTRLGNPNHVVVEEKVADLEGGEAAVATASGMAAISAALTTLLQAGDHVVAGRVLYGCTHSLLANVLRRFGIDTTFVDTTDLEAVAAALRPETRVVYVETPTNPNLELVDLEAVSRIAHRHGAAVVVDNTFCTPYLQRPLALGADVVVHSATKYLNGHGDVIAGFVVGKADFVERLRETALKDLTGAVLGPFEAFLTLRGMKTLSYRMDAHCANAQRVAEFLAGHELVERVIFPGLPSHPQHELVRRQMDGPGGMVSFEVTGGREAAVKVIDAVRLISIAVSLGDIESLIQHPASMTHSSYSPAELEAAGISQGLVRLSVGLEDPEDLIADLDQALRAAVPAAAETRTGVEAPVEAGAAIGGGR